MIRITFEKKGTAIYMSHLDLMRAMTRAVTRAEIPIKYTEGFNPHPYMTFAAPLALGITGEREYFEIKLTAPCTTEELKERIDATLPVGLRILDVTLTERDFNDIESADYTVFCDGKTADEWEKFFAADTLPVEKKTKRGMETVDLKQEILSAQAQDTEGGVLLRLHLPCGNRHNLSPFAVMKAFAPEEDAYYTVARNRFYDQKGIEF